MGRASFVVAVLLLAVLAPPAAADVRRLLSYDAAAGQNPEGVAVDKRGTIYVTLAPLGELRAIDRSGDQRTVATIPVGQGVGSLGVAVDAPGNVYVAHASFDPATHGVHRVTRDGSISRLPGSEAIAFPNGLAFDDRGNLYVTDSIAGAVWRIPRGGEAQPWVQHELLVGDGSFPPPVPIGANGIAYRHGALFVTNSEMARVVRIAIGPGGQPGQPRTIAEDPALYGADGIAIDVHGSLYVLPISQSTLLRLAPDGGGMVTLATAQDGLDFPSSAAFGTGRGERRTLYIVNFAIGPLFGLPPGAGPALLAYDAGVPGLPQP